MTLTRCGGCGRGSSHMSRMTWSGPLPLRARRYRSALLRCSALPLHPPSAPSLCMTPLRRPSTSHLHPICTRSAPPPAPPPHALRTRRPPHALRTPSAGAAALRRLWLARRALDSRGMAIHDPGACTAYRRRCKSRHNIVGTRWAYSSRHKSTVTRHGDGSGSSSAHCTIVRLYSACASWQYWTVLREQLIVGAPRRSRNSAIKL